MSLIWMVRAGQGGYVADEFARGYIAIGWDRIGDLSNAVTAADVRAAYLTAYPDAKPGEVGNAVAMIHKFRSTLKRGDHVVSYDRTRREYLVGDIAGDYAYKPGEVRDHPHTRKVEWLGRVSRDRLRVPSRNTLGSTLTLFSVPPDVWADLSSVLHARAAGPDEPEQAAEQEREDLEESREETQERAHELIKDKLLRLNDSQMEHLVAALLRAMGYRTRVTPKGADRGVDVFASPDGLGFQEPRIKVEVKHRPNSSISAPDIRSFLGGLRPNDRGLYVSTGGFTKEAKYEADRSNTPTTLLDLDELASHVATHYETFDLEGRALISLVKVYWPAE
ncbi:MAG TPA: restriction endonuclease [Thermoanaerobaculia bacterium]|jgi:restriction system protein|nr:restriction endonuclease [Thermoanaerobaculia bacterium]